MSRTISPSSNRLYGVARVVSLWCLVRSGFYAARQRQQQPREPHKRGPKVHSDEELVTATRQLLAEPVFTGEGYRKIWARLRHQGIRTSKDRSTSGWERPTPPRPSLEAEGAVTVFAAIDHCTAECVGIHVVKKEFGCPTTNRPPSGAMRQLGDRRVHFFRLDTCPPVLETETSSNGLPFLEVRRTIDQEDSCAGSAILASYMWFARLSGRPRRVLPSAGLAAALKYAITIRLPT
jgi:hypothetical protein